jgi:hypothetical protein
VKPRFIVFIRGPEKEQCIRESDRGMGLYKVGFVLGPQKFSIGSGKVIHLGTIDWGFTIYQEKYLGGGGTVSIHAQFDNLYLLVCSRYLTL